MPDLTTITLYQWFRGKTGIEFPELDENAFARDVLEAAARQNKVDEQNFVKTKRLIFLKQPLTAEDTESLWFDKPEDYQGLAGFIQYLQNETQLSSGSSYKLILDYLLRHPDTLNNFSSKFICLFKQWLLTDAAKAIAWYEQDNLQKKLLSEHETEYFEIEKNLTCDYLEKTRKLFASVSTPMGFAPLFVEYYENPQQLAAFVLYLLEQKNIQGKDNTSAIISSGLLHDFFLYHSGFLTSDNTLVRFYRLLESFPQARPLVAEAKKTSVMTAEGENEIFNTYSLTGTNFSDFDANKLQVIQLSIVPFNAPELQDYRKFTEQFGQRFIIYLMEAYQHNPDKLDLRQNLYHFLNNEMNGGLSPQELLELLNGLARENNQRLLKICAELLAENMILSFLKDGNFSVFHLLTYRPELLTQLRQSQIQKYLAQSKSAADNDFDQLLLLSTIYGQLAGKIEYQEVSQILFARITKALMDRPQLMDEQLIDILVRNKNIDVLKEQAYQLYETLEASIENLVSEAGELTTPVFQQLEDEWLALLRKFNVLKTISANAVTNQFAADKYDFYAVLASVVFAYQGDSFNLKTILDIIIPECSAPENGFSERECALMAILALINCQEVLDQVIQLPETYCRVKIVFNDLLDTAVKYRDWDLIKRLILCEEENRPDPQVICKAMVRAYKEDQLAGVFADESGKLIALPVAEILRLLVAHAENETLTEFLKLFPDIVPYLTEQGKLTDYSARVFQNISVFQYAVWALADDILETIWITLNEITDQNSAKEMRSILCAQSKEVVEKGVQYSLNHTKITEQHYSIQPLIDKLKNYKQSFWDREDDDRQQDWCHNIGGEQTLIPANFVRKYCISPSLKFYNYVAGKRQHWFSSSGAYRLGRDFAIYKAKCNLRQASGVHFIWQESVESEVNIWQSIYQSKLKKCMDFLTTHCKLTQVSVTRYSIFSDDRGAVPASTTQSNTEQQSRFSIID